MSEVNGRPRPKVGNGFWFDISEKLVTSMESQKAAEKTRDFVKWLWPIYAAGTAIGFGLSGKALPLWTIILMAVAGAALFFVYWSTLCIELPPPVQSFDPRSPNDIKNAFYGVVRWKHKWLKISVGSAFWAAFLVSLALMFASTIKAEKPLPLDMKTVITMVDNTHKLAVTATVGKVEQVFLTVRPVNRERGASEVGPILLIPENGMVYASISLDKMVLPLMVSLELKNASGTKIMLSKEIGNKTETKQELPKKKVKQDLPKDALNGDVSNRDLVKQIRTHGYTTIYVNFDVDKWVIRPESEANIDYVAKMLKNNMDLNLIIAGHTDSSGTWAHNKTLSENRAQGVVQALLARGIDAGRLIALGYGQDKPIADNSTKAGRAKNRRVELIKR